MGSDDSGKKQSMAIPKDGEQGGLSVVSVGKKSQAKSSKSKVSVGGETTVYGSEKKRRRQGT